LKAARLAYIEFLKSVEKRKLLLHTEQYAEDVRTQRYQIYNHFIYRLFHCESNLASWWAPLRGILVQWGDRSVADVGRQANKRIRRASSTDSDSGSTVNVENEPVRSEGDGALLLQVLEELKDLKNASIKQQELICQSEVIQPSAGKRRE
jgi:hypothetical protein